MELNNRPVIIVLLVGKADEHVSCSLSADLCLPALRMTDIVSAVFCHFCEIHGPSVIFCTDVLPLDVIPAAASSESTTSRSCDGCTFDSQQACGFTTTDQKANIRFISSATSSSVYGDRVIQQSCIRSLSCEVYPEGREGVIYFGDQQRGHVLSYCFVLKDSQARGFQRTYSLLLISKQQNVILVHWNRYVAAMQQVVDRLKQKASAIYDREVSPICSQETRALRLDSAVQVAGRGRNSLNTQRSESRARSLKDLTGDETIFALIHLDVAMMLRDLRKKPAATKTPQPEFPVLQMCTLRRLFAMIGRQKFRICAYNVLIGNQILVRSNCPQISRKVLHSLSQLLPETAVRMTFDAEKYFDHKTCNLISISNSIPIPKHAAESSETLIIDMVESDADQVKCTLHSKCRTPDRLPQYLVEVERVIRDTNYSDTSLEMHVQTCKCKWQEKCKIIYTYCQSVGTEMIDDKLLHGIEASDADRPLLHFWTRAAVPVNYKTKLMQIRNQNSS